VVRPLAYPLAGPLGGEIVCAGCVGVVSAFACTGCGSEAHPYGSRRCARCILSERLTDLLTDPATGTVNQRLRPVFEELTGSERPQTTIWWLRKPTPGPGLLRQMARGEVPISHDTFRTLPSTPAYGYVRDLLTAVGVLEPYEPHIAHLEAWLEVTLVTLPREHAEVIRRYARWHVIRNLQQRAAQGRLTRMLANNSRLRIRAAIEFLALLGEAGATIQTATQADLEQFLTTTPGYDRTAVITGFVAWARKSRTNTHLSVVSAKRGMPPVTISDEQRWADIERLLHDDTIRLPARVAGLFTLLFAQPLVRIVAMRTDQVEITDHDVQVAFAETPVQMPPVLDDLIRELATGRGWSLHVARETGWLFPGGRPGRHTATENIRRDLAAIGIKRFEGRKAAMFQLAATMPAPILAELLGTTDSYATAWAALAARDWGTYIQHRATGR